MLEPAYRRTQLGLVEQLSELGANVHLLYGQPEREAVRGLLRHTVHPRFAMICLYKALQSGEEEGEALYSAASRLAWQEARVVLTRDRLEGSYAMLVALGLERISEGRAKLDARQNIAYRDAEADYEECVRLCQSL